LEFLTSGDLPASVDWFDPAITGFLAIRFLKVFGIGFKRYKN
jgi:hypothetical protein